MKITKQQDNDTLTIIMEGELDTIAVPSVEKEIGDLKGVSELIIDLSGVQYIVSSGIRLLAALQETMDEQGKMIVKNVNKDVMEIFELTCLDQIFTIE